MREGAVVKIVRCGAVLGKEEEEEEGVKIFVRRRENGRKKM